ncbi:MAG TPA: dTDP-4-dehydrorhamnose 3,5-epimerase [Candidatus Acidoferrum sp.]|jgi:dTDP-4-dehydrorhamnose 3,5-epimerase|nr:dTDP-4-dehydrorhamnose 3,5-epimerase [Candidatus Acidoferrum sp.]
MDNTQNHKLVAELMKFTETKLEGAYIVDPEPREDARGLFARTFCVRDFEAKGLAGRFAQCSVSVTRECGTIRGLHFQVAPATEAKLVRCTAGSLYDVIVDLRPNSKTYLQHVGVELTASSRRALYVPENFAHGLQTLEGDTEVFYQISEFFAPDLARGLRFDDPKLGIKWPLPVATIAEKDRNWPLLS